MSYPIAHRLLCEASKYNHIEIREVMNWTRIVNDMYSLETIELNMSTNADLDDKVSYSVFRFFLEFLYLFLNFIYQIRDNLFKQKSDGKSRKSNNHLSVFEQVIPTNGTIQKVC